MTEELEDPAEVMRMMAMKLHAKWNIELPLCMGDRIRIAVTVNEVVCEGKKCFYKEVE